MPYLALACQGLLVAVFAVSAISKTVNRQALRDLANLLSQAGLIPVRLAAAAASAMAAVEAVVVVALVVPGTRRLGFAAAAALMVMLTAGVAHIVRQGMSASCRCFGGASATLSRRHVVRNGLLAAIGLTGLLVSSTSAHLDLPAALTAVAVGAVLSLPVLLMDDVSDLIAPRRR